MKVSSSLTAAVNAAAVMLFLLLTAALQPCSAQTILPVQPDIGADDCSPPAETGDPSTLAPNMPQSGQQHAPLTDRFTTYNRLSPVRESWTAIDLWTKYVRAVVGGLEQGASMGLGLQLTTADKIPGVEFRATMLTSVKLYRRFEGEAYIPMVFTKNTHADFWFDYLRRTKDNFFGIGPVIPNTSMTNYDIERRSYSASLYHNLTRRAVLGGYANVTNSSTYRGQRDTDIPIDQLFSGDPTTVPATNWAPGLMINTTILSYGGYIQYDLRDNSIGLTKGAYFYGRIGTAEALKNRDRFADYGWLEAEMDARGYIPLGSNKTSLAVRGFALLRDPQGGSQIPFYDLSYLGGRMYVRGFRDYRFRGNNVALASAELRQTIWTIREDRGLDIFGFGDAGQVWGDNRSQINPTILANQDFSSRNYRASIGGGVQYRYSKSLAGRIEVGHSSERNLIYLSISRGF